MAYKKVTEGILELCNDGGLLVLQLNSLNNDRKVDVTPIEDLRGTARREVRAWKSKCIKFLEGNGLQIEAQQFSIYRGNALETANFDPEIGSIRKYVQDRRAFLALAAEKIEDRKTKPEMRICTIDEFDNFPNISEVSSNEVLEYSHSAFLEDDVEDAFLEALGEPYKEPHSGSETRDLFTDKLQIDGRRLSTVIMFKGRSVRVPLSIDQCGTKGTQLLKLAKNNSAECFVVQHVNKIEPEVREALTDHVLMNTNFFNVYLVFIDGTDTARFLKSRGLDLEEMKKKKNG
jgi:hypothetical protein